MGPDTRLSVSSLIWGKLRNEDDEMDVLKAMEYVSSARQMFGVEPNCLHPKNARRLSHQGEHCDDCGKHF
ncbi:MAG: hypothetical protein QG580_441 [Patescibacteria group bacterium]|jgi:hypothetical protein|nr:hypothetical protein [Patescibacteria group bacterium]